MPLRGRRLVIFLAVIEVNLVQSRKLKNHWLWHSLQDSDWWLCFESGWEWEGSFTTLSVICFTPNVEKKNKNLPRGNGESRKGNKWEGWCYPIPSQWRMLLVSSSWEDTWKTQKSKVSRTVEKPKQTRNRTEWLRFVSGKMAEIYGTEKTGPFSSYSLLYSSEGLLSSLFLPVSATTLEFFLLFGNLSQIIKQAENWASKERCEQLWLI